MARLLLLVVAASAIAGCSSAAPRADDRAQVPVSVSVSACGQGWTSRAAGQQSFELHNVDTRAGTVDLIDAGTGAVYAEVEPIGPGTTTPLRADLGAGRYAFRCAMEDEPAVMGPVVRLTGSAEATTPGVQPVSQGDLIGATKGYQRYVETQLPGLLIDAEALQADLAAGRLTTARRAWLPTHLAYLRLGAAYDAFGDLDADIDARADGRRDGVHDPSWRGLHRIEYGLWHGQSAATLTPLAADLVQAVRSLQRAFPHAQIEPLAIAIRAHEITEDAVEFALTGRDDYGSHSGLASVAADLDGTRVVLGLVDPLLKSRDHGLAALQHQLAVTAADLNQLHHGTWPALSRLARSERERIDGDVSEMAELLAPVAAILEPRRTS